MKRITLIVDGKIHRQFKLKAAKADKTMSQIITEFIKVYLENK